MKKVLRYVLIVVAVLVAFRLFQGTHGGDGADDDVGAVRMLAGSELKDLEFLKPRLEKAAGARIAIEYVGTLDMVDRLADPSHHYDLAWAASAKYLSLASPGQVKASEKTMLSPVVLGLKSAKVAALGWDRKPPSWGEIAAAVKAGKVSFGMTNPTASNSGFSAVVGVASAFAGKGDGLEPADIDTARLRDFFSGVKLTAGSSGWLADAYVADEARLDGLVNYESVILSMNAAHKVHEPLVPVYPQEGILTSDYPLMLLDPARRAVYDKLVAFIKSDEVQGEIMRQTYRRPVSPAVALLPEFGKGLLVELPFPGKLSTVDAILDAYLDEVRVPAHSYFVLDTSGSMSGQRMADLKTALGVLAGGDTRTLGGRFARFQIREQADLIPFSSTVSPPTSIHFADRAGYAKAIGDYQRLVDGLGAGGGTALFEAVRSAYQKAAADRQAAPDAYYTVVVMTDGENNGPFTKDDFVAWYQALPAAQQGIRVFTILFGEGDKDELNEIATLTGGRVFDAKKASLSSVFKDIRGYQ